MLYFSKVFGNKIRHTLQAENISHIFYYPNIPQSASVNPEIHKRSQKIPVAESICKLCRQRLCGNTGNRKVLFIPQLLLPSEPEHRPLTELTSTPYLIRNIGKLPFQPVKTLHIRRAKKTGKGVLVILIAFPRQLLQPFLK